MTLIEGAAWATIVGAVIALLTLIAILLDRR